MRSGATRCVILDTSGLTGFMSRAIASDLAEMQDSEIGFIPTGLARAHHYQRVVHSTPIRVVCDSSFGLRPLLGDLMGITETRCLLRVYAEPDVGVAGRLEINTSGSVLSLPIITRWAHSTGRGWALSVDFDRLTSEKRGAIRNLVRQYETGAR